MVLPPVQSQEIPKLLYDLLFLQVASPQIFWWANGHKELRLAFVGTKLRDLDMEIANGVSFEFLPLWLVALPIRQPRYGVRLLKSDAMKNALDVGSTGAKHTGNHQAEAAYDA